MSSHKKALPTGNIQTFQTPPAHYRYTTNANMFTHISRERSNKKAKEDAQFMTAERYLSGKKTIKQLQMAHHKQKSIKVRKNQ